MTSETTSLAFVHDKVRSRIVNYLSLAAFSTPFKVWCYEVNSSDVANFSYDWRVNRLFVFPSVSVRLAASFGLLDVEDLLLFVLDEWPVDRRCKAVWSFQPLGFGLKSRFLLSDDAEAETRRLGAGIDFSSDRSKPLFGGDDPWIAQQARERERLEAEEMRERLAEYERQMQEMRQAKYSEYLARRALRWGVGSSASEELERKLLERDDHVTRLEAEIARMRGEA